VCAREAATVYQITTLLLSQMV